MNKVNFMKAVCGVSLGTVMVLGSMSSAFAADINHPTTQAKTVELQQQVKSLTQEQAKAIALKQYKGDVKDIQLTKENGKDHEVKIDANTGEICQLLANIKITKNKSCS
jgi:uncharacterized membrane protein YkoI